MIDTEAEIRTRCTDAVFERGQRYRSEGRIRTLERFGETLTAAVQGSSEYDVTVEFSGTAGESSAFTEERSDAAFDARCTCPYDGPGECKHVVAVLLASLEEPPTDEEPRAQQLLEDAPADELHDFLLESFAREPALYERFRVRFGTPPGDDVEIYREEVDTLFDRHTEDKPVVTDAIDFSSLTDRAERYRDRGYDAEAATIYRALVAGIDDNYQLIDAAYDHYARAFQSALDGYVTCAERAASGPDERESYLAFLADQAHEGSPLLREQYQDALAELEAIYGL